MTKNTDWFKRDHVIWSLYCCSRALAVEMITSAHTTNVKFNVCMAEMVDDFEGTLAEISCEI